MTCSICQKEFHHLGIASHRAACWRKRDNERKALVEKFNSKFKVGDIVMWRKDPYSEYLPLTLSHPAAQVNGPAVAWFGGDYCSIDPIFIDYESTL